MLSGLGHPQFAAAASGIMQIHDVFEGHIPPDCLQKSEPRKGAKGMLELDFSNRYFTLGGDVPETEYKDLSVDVDPFSILRKACPNQFATAENDVLYYERRLERTRCVPQPLWLK